MLLTAKRPLFGISSIEDRLRRDRDALVRELFLDDQVLDEEIRHFTGGITMMVNNICNANCIFCAYQYNEDPKETMSLELFKQAMDSTTQCGYLGTLLLTPVAGEPLADPTLFEKIDYAREKGVKIIMFATNGLLLKKDDNYKKIIDREVDLITLSVPRLDPMAYEIVYRSKRYDRLLEGLIALFDYKAAVGGKTRLILAIRLDMPLKEAMQSEGMRRIKSYIDAGVVEIKPRLDYDNWSGHIKQEDLVGDMRLKAPQDLKGKPPCFRMVHDLAVLPEGTVRVCSCRYFRTNFDELAIGHIKEKPMREILFGDRHKKLLQDVARNKWPRVCQSCTIYEPVTFTDDRIKAMDAKRTARSKSPSWLPKTWKSGTKAK